MPAEVIHLGSIAHGSVDTLLGTRLPDLVVVDLNGHARRLRDLPTPLVLEIADGRHQVSAMGADPLTSVAERYPSIQFPLVLSRFASPATPGPMRLAAARSMALHLIGHSPRPVLLDDAHCTVLRSLDASAHAVFVVGTEGRLLWRSDRPSEESLHDVLDTLLAPVPVPAGPTIFEEFVELMEHRISFLRRVVMWLPNRLRGVL